MRWTVTENMVSAYRQEYTTGDAAIQGKKRLTVLVENPAAPAAPNSQSRDALNGLFAFERPQIWFDPRIITV